MSSERRFLKKLAPDAIARYRSMMPGEREIAVRAVEIRDQVGRTASSSARLYVCLDPPRRELTEAERAVLRAQLEAGAVCLRSIDKDRDIIEFLAVEGQRTDQEFDLGPTISLLRVIQRSFVLALSADPIRREQAIAVRDLQALIRPVYEFWQSLPVARG